MPDFSALLRRPAGVAKPQPLLPEGDYPAIIKSWSIGELTTENKTTYVRFNLTLLDWPESVGAEDRGTVNEETGEITSIDLSKRPIRKDVFITDESLYIFDRMIKSFGVAVGNGERSYEEVLPETVGVKVIASIGFYTNKNTNEMRNQVNALVGEG